MARAAALAMIDKAALPLALSIGQMDRAYLLSGGHPLAMSYLIQLLTDASDLASVTRILDNANPYEGHIDKTYEIYWHGIEQKAAFRELLALLARLRVAFDPRKLEAWAGKDAVQALVREGHIYFRKETPHRWQFFHNSFRQFLIDKTSRDILDERDETLHRSFHQRLAVLCASQTADGQHNWEALYHYGMRW